MLAALSTLGAPDDAGALPLFDAPCGGGSAPTPVPAPVTCRTPDGRAITLRLDAPTGAPAAALYAYPGEALIGGPRARARGVVVYSQDGALRWTTSHRRARELARQGLLQGMLGAGSVPPNPPPRLFFGHEASPDPG